MTISLLKVSDILSTYNDFKCLVHLCIYWFVSDADLCRDNHCLKEELQTRSLAADAAQQETEAKYQSVQQTLGETEAKYQSVQQTLGETEAKYQSLQQTLAGEFTEKTSTTSRDLRPLLTILYIVGFI